MTTSSGKDPRKPKKNPELKFTEQAMRDSWRRFRTADNYSEKRGNAMILQAHLEEWLNQPERICDLEEGVSSDTGAPYRLNDIPEDAELVFDRGGSAEDAFFFYTGGSISQLFAKAELDADPEKVRKYGYYVVTVYQKLYATTNMTAMHFTSEEGLRRHMNSSAPPGFSKDNFDVLADPLGCPDPTKCHLVSRYGNLKRAEARADKLAEKYGIRFVVAKILGLVDNH